MSEPQRWERRYITKFLWLPHTVRSETRWLRKVTIKQIYMPGFAGGHTGQWEDEEWA